MFSTQTYVLRRDNLAASVSKGIILLMGNRYSSRNYKDNHYPFRQDSTFLYYVGISRPELALVIDVASGKTILFGNEADEQDLIWTGPSPQLSFLAEKSGITDVRPYTEIKGYLAKHIDSKAEIHYLPPYSSDHIYLLSHWLGLPTFQSALIPSKSLIYAIIQQRQYKDELELEQIQQALDITHHLHTISRELALPGIKEKAILGECTKYLMEAGSAYAYAPILTIQGNVLHHHSYDNTLASGQFLLVDMGAESDMGYASDITRTFPVGRKFSDIQGQLYQVVLNAQQAAIDALSPGVAFLDIHLLSSKKLVEGLKELDMMSGDTEEIIAAGAHALFFPHGLGHMMGLDVHDMENLGEDYVGYGSYCQRSNLFGLHALRLAKKLEPGFVVTIEPGFYMIKDLIYSWKAQKKFTQFINYEKLGYFMDLGGIRIEDDILITQIGHKVLSSQIEKKISDIEIN